MVLWSLHCAESCSLIKTFTIDRHNGESHFLILCFFFLVGLFKSRPVVNAVCFKHYEIIISTENIIAINIVFCLYNGLSLDISVRGSSDLLRVQMGENIRLNCSMRNQYEVTWYHLRSEQLELLIAAEKDKTGRKLQKTVL